MLKKILFVEDEPDIQLIVQASLKHFGNYDVLVCNSGEEALRNAENFKAELILLDVMMPHMDGPTTLAKLRHIDGYANLPAVFMTAKTQPNEVSEFLNFGAVDVIAKPFDPIMLSTKLHEIYVKYHDGKNK